MREQTSDDIRKGFKFTKKSAQVVGASETIAFDDLEEEVSTPIAKRGRIQIDDNKAGMTMKNQKNANALSYSGSPKAKEINSLVDNTVESVMPVEISKDSTGKKRKTSPDNSLLGLRASQSSKNVKADEATSSGAAVKRRSTNGKKGTQEVNSHVQKTVVEAEKIEENINHTSSSAKAKEIQKKIVTKAYYPKINYDPLQSKVLSDSTVNESSHTNILSKLVKEICEIESIGLKEYSDENKGRESIIAALQEVLSQLPEEILSACNDDMTFLPELSVDEKEETESLKRTLSILNKQSVELEKYESNISELGRHYNLWIDGVPESIEAELISTAAEKGNECQVFDVVGMVKNYDQVLSDVDSQCGKLLDLSENLDTLKTTARLTQESLYETTQTVRMKGTSSSSSSDPKDLIRNLIKL